MGQEIIIDGHNFIGCNAEYFPSIDVNRKGAREDLLRLLSEYAQIRDVAITVVFDNKTNFGSIYGDKSNYGRIRVMYSPMGREADEVILDLIRQSSNKKAVIVVSSDKKDIGRMVSGEGCIVKKSDEFMRILQKALDKAGTK